MVLDGLILKLKGTVHLISFDKFSRLVQHKYLPMLYKLDGVGPVDNRPSINKLYQFIKKKEKKSDM